MTTDNPSPSQETLTNLQQAIDTLKQKLPPGPVLDAALTPLLHQRDTLLAQLGDHNVAISDSDMSGGDGSVLGSSARRDINTGTVVNADSGATVNVGGSPAPPDLDPEIALDRYLSHVIETNRRLQLQGIRSAGELVSIELEQVYITLTATTRQSSAAGDEAWLAESAGLAPGEGHRRSGGDGPSTSLRTGLTAVPVQQALADHARLVVLGDPGSGKTTLLRYLSLTYARALAGESGLVNQRLNLKEQRLPILLPLRDFARHLVDNHPDPGLDGPTLLLDYLRSYFANQGIALPDGFFAVRLEQGEGAVLLDGVDEVANLPTRYRIARMIERFTNAYPNNRYVVTSRLVGYTDSARLGVDYAVTRVRDFSDRDIEHFVSHWNLAVELTLARSTSSGQARLTSAGADTPEVETEARRLAQQQSAALLDAIQNNERVRELAVNPLLLTVIALVQRYRAQLPERRTELYEEAIEVLLGQWDVGKGLTETALVAGRVLDAGDRRSMLEPIALAMMEQQWREIEVDELKRQLSKQFLTMISDRREVVKAVEGFVRLISERSGLLVERGYGVVSFSHLTFQEQLAARAVADRDDYLAYSLARLGDSWWREVILLEAGYLSTQGQRRVTALIKAIMGHPDEPELFHNLVLAAECVRDVGAARLKSDVAGEIQRRIQAEFAQPLQKGDRTTIERRAAAAAALARIESGGSGLQPAFWRPPYGEPVWVDIPAGEFWLGEGETTHRLSLPAYQIARTPISNTQYALFIEATGHKPPGDWDGNRLPRGKESHPVVNVTWHDALAYCKWLSEQTGKAITLPSEAEWEKAARGDKDKRVYPWGDAWDATKCNNGELGLRDTTPVGIFPEGTSPYGCLDMAGNVWEWTRSAYEAYPYDASDGREDLKRTDVPRVLRGGAFGNESEYVRCATRLRYFPDYSDFNSFRVVVSPLF